MDSSGLFVDDTGMEKELGNIDTVDDSSMIRNLAMDPPSSGIGSKIVTLEPFQKNVNRRKTKYRPDPTLIHFDSLFGLDNWSRFLVLKTSKKISSTKLENILLSHCPTKEMSFRPLKPNEWLIEVTTQNQSEIFQSLNEIEGIDISIRKHDTLNSIQGTVVLPTIEDEDEFPNKYLLLDSLQKRYDNVQDIELYELPNKKYPNRSLRIARIKFEGQSLPQKIKIQGQNREVRPYIPKPLQCKSCSKFGHSENKCQSIRVCAFCSSADHPTTWNCGTPKCVNCGLEHHARAKECTFYMYNTELKLLVSRTGMSFREAKLELKVRGFKDPSKNPLYKTRVRNIIPQNIIEKYDDNIMNKKSAKLQVNKNSKTKERKPVDTNNFFGVLESVEVEIHQESIDDSENHQLNTVNVEETSSSRQNKRPYEKLSPVRRNTKEGIQRSVKPKIQRNQNELTKKVKSGELANNNEESINSSPVFNSKFKNSKQPTDKIHEENCKCMECFQGEINENSELPHNSTCGCHECFVHECMAIKPLTKEKLIIMIRSFIDNKFLNEDNQLDSHPSECMCKNHLIYYKKNKVTILDKFLSQQKINIT